MPFGYIYKIVFPHGKHYIGLTSTSLKQRTKEHKCSAKSGNTKCLYKALRKYDMADTFELIEIDTADTLEELCKKEIHYILEYNSYYMDGNGYNMTYGGEGTTGYVYTEDVKQNMSETKKKYHEDNPEAGKEHGERMKKYYEENPEARQKNSEAQQKYYEEHPEAREQMSEIKKKYYENPEARQKNSEAQKKRFENPEEIQKNSEAQKKYHEDNPEAGQEHGERMKKYYEENPEAREQMSEIKKKYNKEHPEARKEHGERMKKYYEHPEARKEHGERMKKYNNEHPEAGKEHGERMKKYYEENPEARQKLLDAKGQNNPFDVFKDGTFIKTFTYQYDAREYLQKEHHITSTIKISEVLAGKRISSAGFVFKYK